MAQHCHSRAPTKLGYQSSQHFSCLMPDDRIQVSRMKDVVAYLRLEEDENRAIRICFEETSEQKMILDETQPKDMDKDNGAGSIDAIPTFGEAEKIADRVFQFITLGQLSVLTHSRSR